MKKCAVHNLKRDFSSIYPISEHTTKAKMYFLSSKMILEQLWQKFSSKIMRMMLFNLHTQQKLFGKICLKSHFPLMAPFKKMPGGFSSRIVTCFSKHDLGWTKYLKLNQYHLGCFNYCSTIKV